MLLDKELTKIPRLGSFELGKVPSKKCGLPTIRICPDIIEDNYFQLG